MYFSRKHWSWKEPLRMRWLLSYQRYRVSCSSQRRPDKLRLWRRDRWKWSWWTARESWRELGEQRRPVGRERQSWIGSRHYYSLWRLTIESRCIQAAIVLVTYFQLIAIETLIILNTMSQIVVILRFRCICIVYPLYWLIIFCVQGEHYNQLLENERRMVVSLRSSLQAKERELTETMDKFLQEKVALAKVQGELVALRARCETDQQHISSLQSKVCHEHNKETLEDRAKSHAA